MITKANCIYYVENKISGEYVTCPESECSAVKFSIEIENNIPYDICLKCGKKSQLNKTLMYLDNGVLKVSDNRYILYKKIKIEV